MTRRKDPDMLKPLIDIDFDERQPQTVEIDDELEYNDQYYYEELLSPYLDKYDYTNLGELDGGDC